MKWKPSKTQRRQFAERMQNPEERAAYEARKRERADKRRAGSKYEYASAGGEYIPTREQYAAAMEMNTTAATTAEERSAANMVIYGYNCQEKVHHDYIHLVNEYRRKAK